MTPLQQTGFPDLQQLTWCSAKDFLWPYPPCIQPTSSFFPNYFLLHTRRGAQRRACHKRTRPSTSSCIYWAATQSHCHSLSLRSWQLHLRLPATGYLQTHACAHGRVRTRRYMPVAYPDTKPVPPVSFDFGATNLSFAGYCISEGRNNFSTRSRNANNSSLCRLLSNAHKSYCSAQH